MLSYGEYLTIIAIINNYIRKLEISINKNVKMTLGNFIVIYPN